MGKELKSRGIATVVGCCDTSRQAQISCGGRVTRVGRLEKGSDRVDHGSKSHKNTGRTMDIHIQQ